MRLSSCAAMVSETARPTLNCLPQVHGCHNFFIGLDLVFSRIPLVSYVYQASSMTRVMTCSTSACYKLINDVGHTDRGLHDLIIVLSPDNLLARTPVLLERALACVLWEAVVGFDHSEAQAVV